MLPYLTSDIPGIGGAIKQRAEDFFVQEIPLYEPIGDGEHVYCEVQKIGLTTFDAINRIGHALNISSRDIGYAGLKDARALTRQIFSIPGTTPEAVMQLNIAGLSIQWAARHTNKLRMGHLKGNRFAIKVRDVSPTDVVKLGPAIDILQKRGMPNFFGDQRFGRRNDNDKLGAALLAGDDERVIKQLLGAPDSSVDDPESLAAREAFDAGDFATAIRKYPRFATLEVRVLARLMKTGDASKATHAIDQKIRRLWISALQSRLFNQILATRMTAGTMHRLIDGDLAMKHENGACFIVEDLAMEQPRCEAFEISPTGPMVGYRMTLPRGEALAIEEAAFGEAGLNPESFRNDRERAKGDRRALRVQPADIELAGGADEHGPHVTFAFTLPAGSYATTFLREFMKTDADDTASS